MKTVLLSGAALILSLACLPATAVDEPAESRPAGTWLSVSLNLFVNPDRAQAIWFDHKYLGKDSSRRDVWLIDIAGKTARKLFTLPLSLKPDGYNVHEYAALTEDEKYLLLDQELQDGEKTDGRGMNLMQQGDKKWRHVYLRRNVYALPLEYTGEVEAVRITKDVGDHSAWTYDAVTKKVCAITAQKGKEGLVAYTLDGKRAALWGMQPPPPKGVNTGNSIDWGFSLRQHLCWMEDRAFAIAGQFDVICFSADAPAPTVEWGHEKFSSKAKVKLPAVVPQNCSFTLGALAPTSDRKGLLLFLRVFTQGNEPQRVSGQLLLLDKIDGGTWRKVGDLPSIQVHAPHTLCASADGTKAWIINNRGSGTSFVSQVDLKTGKLTNVWASDDIEKIASNLAK
ncbi:MAG TPA: hypothetical protein VEJ63_00225 [Planctomycetota bacterium]|nr:hypothetical protein [Planctomycetota bacterium]